MQIVIHGKVTAISAKEDKTFTEISVPDERFDQLPGTCDTLHVESHIFPLREKVKITIESEN